MKKSILFLVVLLFCTSSLFVFAGPWSNGGGGITPGSNATLNTANVTTLNTTTANITNTISANVLNVTTANVTNFNTGNANITGGNVIGTNITSSGIATLTNQSWNTASIAAATTTDLSTINGTLISITGSNAAINGFGNVPANIIKVLKFTGSNITIGYNATSLITPGVRNYNLNANDRMTLVSLGSTNWFVQELVKASGYATGTSVTNTYTTTSAVNIEDLYGKIIYADGAVNLTLTLSSAVAGMGSTYICANADCCLDVQAADVFRYGTYTANMTAGNKLCSTGGAGSSMHFICRTTGIWWVDFVNSTWYDGGS